MLDAEAQTLLEHKQIEISDFVEDKLAFRFTCYYSPLLTPHDKNPVLHDTWLGLQGGASCTCLDFQESLADSTSVIGVGLNESHGLRERRLVNLLDIYRQLYYVLAAEEPGGVSR